MRKVVLLLVFALFMVSLVSAAPYPGYPAFSVTDGRLSLTGTSLTASDSIVYSTGYYSINAGAWVPFSFTGTGYLGGTAWLGGSASASLPNFGDGEHYVVVFSCTKGATSWDCHDMRWQLLVVGEGEEPENPAPIIVGDSLCGDGTCDSAAGETCSLCRFDCGSCTLSNYDSFPAASTCGDGICDTTEYCSVCAADCNTCPEIECPCDSNHDCVNGVCLQKPTGSGKRYFVATNGNDGASGSITAPWRTWGKAFNAMGAGDIIYIRGGVYTYPGGTNGYLIEKSGTSSHRITIANYPGERPVLDFAQTSSGTSSTCSGETNLYGIKLRQVSYFTVRGLEIRNLWQRDGCDVVSGLEVGRGNNVLIENVVVHDVGGNCIPVGGTEVYVRNSDAYHCVDYITSTPASNPLPGNDGTGITDGTWMDNSGRVYFYGNRAWNAGDQGFSTGSIGYTEVDTCWSMHNGVLQGGGHAFKMGWIAEYTSGLLNRLYTNNIAADNWDSGWSTNDGTKYPAGTLDVFNNFAYKNKEGFELYGTAASDTQEAQRRNYRNNIAFRNSNDIAIYHSAQYTHSQNSWDSGVTLTDADFESLDVSQLYLPRNADGSLPAITFGKVVSGSDLITQGVYVN